MDPVQELENKIILLKCDDDETRSLKANLTVLAQHSKYFEGNASFSADGEVTFDSKIVSFAALKKIIAYLVSADLNPTIEDFDKLWLAADYLQIDAAFELLFQFLYKDLEMEMKCLSDTPKAKLLVYLRSYAFTRRYEIKTNYEYKKMTLNYTQYKETYEHSAPIFIGVILSYHFQRIWNEPEVFNLDLQWLREIIVSNYLLISEEEVLRTVKMWVNYDLNTRKKSFQTLLKCVRPGLSAKIVVDELMCQCKELTCTCLASPAFGVAVLAYRVDNQIKDDNGPSNWTERSRIRYLNV